MKISKNIVIAVPKGRISIELQPILEKIDIKVEDDFYNENSRKLMFKTENKKIQFIRVRSFDVATFVAYGAADIGVVGNDVLQEFDYPDLYSLLDLKIGKCRLSIASLKEAEEDADFWNQSHIRVATKYINITKKYFAQLGIQAECIKLNGAIELAPKLGLCRRIVDLVSSGATLEANGLKEVQNILDVTSRLIVNKNIFKVRGSEISPIIEAFKKSII